MYSVQCCPQQTINLLYCLCVRCNGLPCATCVFYLIKSVFQDLPNSPCLNRLNLTIMRNKLILIQDSFHMFRSFTLLDLEPEHTLQKQCTGGTCYTNLHFKVTSICLINDIRSNSSHTVVSCKYISCNVPSSDIILSLLVSTLFAQYKFVSIAFYH